ncbi:MAG: protein kinase [Candidatus Obscuribacterales bacterium]|nr:protein kinase [Candidatus Obscuribacterales bacterium]
MITIVLGNVGRGISNTTSLHGGLAVAEVISLPTPEELNLSASDFGNRYEILETLGQGGMGTVLKGRHTGLKKLVAIKILNADMEMDANSKQRFTLEAQAGSKLSHPNLVSVFDFGFIGESVPYLVMEYIEGMSLDFALATYGRPSADQLIDVFKQVAKALQHIHNNGIVHRDLKPGNIMIQVIDGERYVKLLDFGIAKFLGEEASNQHLTKTGAIFGSPPYMSPEQCIGKKTDLRSDIYALGCVMYECMAGAPPLLGDNSLHTVFRHANEQPEPLAPKCNGLIELGFASLIHKSLETNPDSRFQTAGEVLTALNGVIEGAAVLSNTGNSLVSPARASERRSAAQPALAKPQGLQWQHQQSSMESEEPKPMSWQADSSSTGGFSMLPKRSVEDLRYETGSHSLEVKKLREKNLEPAANSGGTTLVLTACVMVLLGAAGYLGWGQIQHNMSVDASRAAIAAADSTFASGRAHYAEAQQKYEQALEMVATDDDEAKGRIQARLGRIQVSRGELTEAFDKFAEASRRLRLNPQNNQEHYLEALVGMADIRSKQKSYSQAEDYYAEARDLATDWRRNNQLADVLAKSAKNERYLNYERSANLYDQAIDVYENETERRDEALANTLLESAQVRMKQGFGKDARARLERALAACSEISNDNIKNNMKKRISHLMEQTQTITDEPPPKQVISKNAQHFEPSPVSPKTNTINATSTTPDTTPKTEQAQQEQSVQTGLVESDQITPSKSKPAADPQANQLELMKAETALMQERIKAAREVQSLMKGGSGWAPVVQELDKLRKYGGTNSSSSTPSQHRTIRTYSPSAFSSSHSSSNSQSEGIDYLQQANP